jgi:hypothetical protein
VLFTYRLTEDIEHELAEADEDAYEAWIDGDEQRAEQLESRADALRDELARRQNLEATHRRETAA